MNVADTVDARIQQANYHLFVNLVRGSLLALRPLFPSSCLVATVLAVEP